MIEKSAKKERNSLAESPPSFEVTLNMIFCIIAQWNLRGPKKFKRYYILTLFY